MDSDYMAHRASSPISAKSSNKKDFGISQSLLILILILFDPYFKFNYLIVALVRVCE
jgi:hypothetical protein